LGMVRDEEKVFFLLDEVVYKVLEQKLGDGVVDV